ncbi:hypothetical protein [Burkholderia gladioli]|uniref:hypothetical protein n=1 Tax=Burkholderia gladioli TaxID=28095 RepID=UPI001C5F2A57|nr:hypothetical protein [Burkholderia gladioli]MBW5286736.1 hypothetical protein [Burkholderia gladioli]
MDSPKLCQHATAVEPIALTDVQRATLTQAADFLEQKHSRLAAATLRVLLGQLPGSTSPAARWWHREPTGSDPAPIGFRTRVPGFEWVPWLTDDQETIRSAIADAHAIGSEAGELYGCPCNAGAATDGKARHPMTYEQLAGLVRSYWADSRRTYEKKGDLGALIEDIENLRAAP